KKAELVRLLTEIFSDKVSTTVINEDKPMRSAEHPTMKPLKLLERLIKNSSRPGELVLDTFGGSGSTMMTCEQLNRTCYMMELDPIYCDVIVQRYINLKGHDGDVYLERDGNKIAFSKLGELHWEKSE
ncbi:MAG TPA: site-specific DNA-methyltransferase, partial [Clostridiales bacterium]|nr:site-specific DNA-methyltransferase [Clostridiales bacterium]